MANNTLTSQPLVRRFPICARMGAIVGALVGMVFGLVQLNLDPAISFSVAELVQIGLILGLFGWLSLLVIIGIWLRYGFASIAILALVIALVVSVVVVFALDAIGVPESAMLLGLVLGMLVGAVICWLLCMNGRLVRAPVARGGKPDANG